jgi:hypothetical protein
MTKYGREAADEVAAALHEMKVGTLKSGSGEKVKSRKQAIAIGLSEARKAHGKVPPKKHVADRREARATHQRDG